MSISKARSSFIRRSIRGVILAGAFVSLSGCWEPPGVTYHEPGVYKGAEGNLTVDTAALQERVKGQMDR